MNVSDIFKEAFKFPASNWKRFLILGVIALSYTFLLEFGTFKYNPYVLLMIIPTYIILFLYRGYTLRAIKTSINGNNEIPAFNEWTRMFLNGLKVLFAGIVYF